MLTEADTCRKYVLPKLIQAGWDNDPHSFTEQKTFTDGRIVVIGNKTRRRTRRAAALHPRQSVQRGTVMRRLDDLFQSLLHRALKGKL